LTISGVSIDTTARIIRLPDRFARRQARRLPCFHLVIDLRGRAQLARVHASEDPIGGTAVPVVPKSSR
jgi:hypothetical protein